MLTNITIGCLMMIATTVTHAGAMIVVLRLLRGTQRLREEVRLPSKASPSLLLPARRESDVLCQPGVARNPDFLPRL